MSLSITWNVNQGIIWRKLLTVWSSSTTHTCSHAHMHIHTQSTDSVYLDWEFCVFLGKIAVESLFCYLKWSSKGSRCWSNTDRDMDNLHSLTVTISAYCYSMDWEFNMTPALNVVQCKILKNMPQNNVKFNHWKSCRSGCLWVNAGTPLCMIPELY